MGSMATDYPRRGLCGQDFSELFVPRGVGRDFLLRVLNVGIKVTVPTGSCPASGSCQKVTSGKQFKRENLTNFTGVTPISVATLVTVWTLG